MTEQLVEEPGPNSSTSASAAADWNKFSKADQLTLALRALQRQATSKGALKKGTAPRHVVFEAIKVYGAEKLHAADGLVRGLTEIGLLTRKGSGPKTTYRVDPDLAGITPELLAELRAKRRAETRTSQDLPAQKKAPSPPAADPPSNLEKLEVMLQARNKALNKLANERDEAVAARDKAMADLDVAQARVAELEQELDRIKERDRESNAQAARLVEEYGSPDRR